MKRWERALQKKEMVMKREILNQMDNRYFANKEQIEDLRDSVAKQFRDRMKIEYADQERLRNEFTDLIDGLQREMIAVKSEVKWVQVKIGHTLQIYPITENEYTLTKQALLLNLDGDARQAKVKFKGETVPKWIDIDKWILVEFFIDKDEE